MRLQFNTEQILYCMLFADQMSPAASGHAVWAGSDVLWCRD